MKLTGLAKKILISICIFAALLMAASFVYYRSAACLPFVFGVLLGTLTSVAKVIILELSIDKALGMTQKAAGNYTRLIHLLRLALTGAVLVLAALVPQISLWGAAAGIITFQLSVYIHRLFAGK